MKISKSHLKQIILEELKAISGAGEKTPSISGHLKSIVGGKHMSQGYDDDPSKQPDISYITRGPLSKQKKPKYIGYAFNKYDKENFYIYLVKQFDYYNLKDADDYNAYLVIDQNSINRQIDGIENPYYKIGDNGLEKAINYANTKNAHISWDAPEKEINAYVPSLRGSRLNKPEHNARLNEPDKGDEEY